VNKFTTRKPVSLKEEKRWIQNLKKFKKQEHHFAINTNKGFHIGSVSLLLSLMDKNANFSILIGDKNYWNKGYGREAIKIILNYAFNKLRLNRIYLGVISYNKRAIRLYKKFGFKLEGRSREHIFYKGKFYDLLEMGILKNEWQKLNKK